jgi:hypothetical protein
LLDPDAAFFTHQIAVGCFQSALHDSLLTFNPRAKDSSFALQGRVTSVTPSLACETFLWLLDQVVLRQHSDASISLLNRCRASKSAQPKVFRAFVPLKEQYLDANGVFSDLCRLDELRTRLHIQITPHKPQQVNLL